VDGTRKHVVGAEEAEVCMFPLSIFWELWRIITGIADYLLLGVEG
jgi:hypothetical protein